MTKTTYEVAPDEVRAGDYAVTPAGRFEVMESLLGLKDLLIDLGPFQVGISLLPPLGVTFERDVPDTPRIPDSQGAVIRIHGHNEFNVYTRGQNHWVRSGVDGTYSQGEVQSAADKYGFTVFSPAPKPPTLAVGQVWKHEDGRSFLIRGQSLGMYLPDVYSAMMTTVSGGPSEYGWSNVTVNGLLAAGFTLDEEESDG